MKRNNIIVYLFSGVTLFSACHDLDLNPLSNGSTENWYSNETEIEMAVNELYRDTFGRWMKKVIPIGLTIRFIVKI